MLACDGGESSQRAATIRAHVGTCTTGGRISQCDIVAGFIGRGYDQDATGNPRQLMQPIHQLLARIKHDPNYGAGEFELGYADRFDTSCQQRLDHL